MIDVQSKTPEAAPNPLREANVSLAKYWANNSGKCNTVPGSDRHYDRMTLVKLDRCPGLCNGEGNATCVLKVFDGHITVHCMHERCKGFDFETVFGKCPLQPKPWLFSFNDMKAVTDKQGERPLVIHGLLRRGDTANIIAASKIGKSHIQNQLALSIASGEPWFGYEVEQGPVGIIDNELHPDSIIGRLDRMRKAMGLPESVMKNITIASLRGQLKTLPEICDLMDRVKPGTFSILFIDALYRTVPKGMDENSNADITSLYNLLDNLARRQQCACCSVHHASKGKQTGKAVSDVGSGAGAQSRAVDLHLVLRPFTTPDTLVLDGVVRDFPPIDSKILTHDYPLWKATDVVAMSTGPTVSEVVAWLEPGDYPKDELEKRMREHYRITQKDARELLTEAIGSDQLELHKPHKQKHFIRRITCPSTSP